jgi:uncharacterized protein involved in exopolysaccharide biosynthesis
MTSNERPIVMFSGSTSVAETRSAGSAPEIALVAPLNLVLSHWRPLVIVPLLFATAAAAYGLLQGSYVAQSAFVSESGNRNQASQLLGLASQFGLNVGPMAENVSPDFYSWLVRSRGMLIEVVNTQYHFSSGGRDTVSGTLVDLYRVSGATPEVRERKAIRKLAANLTVSIDRPSTVLTLRTTARWPALAEAINRRLLDLINTFNVERRQSSAAAQRDFAQRRVQEAQGEVTAAEAAMRDFLLRNRRVANAPDLMLEQARLQRVLTLRQQVLVTLTQSYEQSRVDAVRDTPVITVVEAPEGSARSAAGILRRAILGGVLGFLTALIIVIVREYARRQRDVMPGEYAEFDALWQKTTGLWKRRAGPR